MKKQKTSKTKEPGNIREFFYVLLLFVFFEFAVLAGENGLGELYRYIAITGLWLTLNWSVFAFLRYGRRKVSQKTSAFLDIKMVERVFPYFITPLVLVCAIFVNLYLDKSALMRQLVILISVGYLWAIFVHIKNSYKEQFSISGYTRVIFKFADIFLFYLVVNSAYLLPLESWAKTIITIAVTAVLLMHQLRLYRQNSFWSYIVYVISTCVLAGIAIFVHAWSPLLTPLIMTIVFYLVIGTWYVRLSGNRRFVDYLNPILFALMALIVVLSF